MPFNFILENDRLTRSPEGDLSIGLRVPDDFVFPGYPTEQTGDWVKMALNKPNKWQGEPSIHPSNPLRFLANHNACAANIFGDQC